MRELNKTTDLHKYLRSGNLTKPFLPTWYVFDKITLDYETKTKQGKVLTKLDCIITWIKHNVKMEMEDKEFIKNKKFQRTANEIWESGKATGCTDYAILFCVFARQLGYPCTLLHTASNNWINSYKNGETTNHSGHSFCECYINGKWVLVDPTFSQITQEYNIEKLNLDYKVGNCNIFYPYIRDLDLKAKQTIKEHNDNMDKLCQNI